MSILKLKMSLEEATKTVIPERGKISFPQRLNVDEVENLFEYILNESGIETEYIITVMKRIGNERRLTINPKISLPTLGQSKRISRKISAVTQKYLVKILLKKKQSNSYAPTQ